MYPEYVEVYGTKYKINTDFRVALECNRIAEDKTIGDLERSLGIIYTLFGEEALYTPEHHEKLLELAKKYLLCGKEYDTEANAKPDMDFEQDYGLIWASFMSDYSGMDIDKEEIHWWKFMDLMNGLSNSETGNCCVLNRVRNLRNFDVKEIKDAKEKQRIMKAKQQFALKKLQKEPTAEQRKRADDLYKKLGIERK